MAGARVGSTVGVSDSTGASVGTSVGAIVLQSQSSRNEKWSITLQAFSSYNVIHEYTHGNAEVGI